MKESSGDLELLAMKLELRIDKFGEPLAGFKGLIIAGEVFRTRNQTNAAGGHAQPRGVVRF